MSETNQLYQSVDIVAAYDHMELIPRQIVSCIQNFNQQVTEEKERHAQAINAVEQRHQQKLQEMENARRAACEGAAKRKNEYFSRLDAPVRRRRQDAMPYCMSYRIPGISSQSAER